MRSDRVFDRAFAVAGTLPNDFSLRGNMTQEYKGEDKTEGRTLPAEVDGNNPLSTAGPPGDKFHRKDFQVCFFFLLIRRCR